MQSLSNAMNDTVKLRLKCPNTFLGSILMCSCYVVFLHHLIIVISFSEISYGSETSLLISASGCLIYDLNHSDSKRKAPPDLVTHGRKCALHCCDFHIRWTWCYKQLVSNYNDIIYPNKIPVKSSWNRKNIKRHNSTVQYVHTFWMVVYYIIYWENHMGSVVLFGIFWDLLCIIHMSCENDSNVPPFPRTWWCCFTCAWLKVGSSSLHLTEV